MGTARACRLLVRLSPSEVEKSQEKLKDRASENKVSFTLERERDKLLDLLKPGCIEDLKRFL